MNSAAVSVHDSRFFELGSCRGLDPELFHPERGGSTTDAKAVCGSCRVRVPCLEWALATRQPQGIWGGTSERERRRIRRRLAAGEPVPQLDPEWVPTLGSVPLIPPPPEELTMDLAVADTPPLAEINGSRPIDPITGKPTDACVNCGRRYTPVKSDQRFCRKECARAWYASHPRGEGGTRQPRVRRTSTVSKTTAASSAAMPAPTNAPPPVPTDVQTILGQLLGACDRWAIEADLGDIRISVTRNCG